MSDELFSTNSYDDPDPEGTDVYGMIPLIALVEDSDDNDDDDDDEDRRPEGLRPEGLRPESQQPYVSGADEGDQDLSPMIEPSTIEIEVPEGTTFDDDDDAYQTLTARGATDLFPGEARALIKYMRPLTPEEQDLAEDPYLNDLRWTDDPAHVDDVLKAGKGEGGLDSFLDDATYGDIHMKTPEEAAERRFGNDKDIGTKLARRETVSHRVADPRVADPRVDRKFVVKATNASVVVGLSRKLKVEHANWLAEQDKSAGIAVRPRAYYENVAKLWTAKQLKDAKIPTTTSGNWVASPMKFVRAAQGVLVKTEKVRSRFSPVLGDQVDMGGWNPFSAAKSAIKKVVKYTVAKPLEYGYKYGKKAVSAPFTYTYKGIKYVGEKAKQLALAPLKVIIRRYTGKMINNRANAIAKQKGLSAPTAVEKADASSWAKNYVRKKGGKYGSVIASLMGSSTRRSSTQGSYPEYGMRNVDISFGNADVIGLSKAGTAGLILLGPIGLIALLTGLVKTSGGGGAQAPAAGTQESESEKASADDGSSESSDSSTTDPGEGSSDSSTSDPGGGSTDSSTTDDGSTDSSGSVSNQLKKRATISVEQLNSLSPQKRALAQRLIRTGRIRLA
jgi:hypothetical protein